MPRSVVVARARSSVPRPRVAPGPLVTFWGATCEVPAPTGVRPGVSKPVIGMPYRVASRTAFWSIPVTVPRLAR